MTAIALAIALTLSPMTAGAVEPVVSGRQGSCTGYSSRTTPPRTIRVFRARLHRVDRVPFRLYVKRVLASGAWPAWLPLESIKVGAVVVAQYARWEMAQGHRTGRRSGHRCFDIRDGGWGQYYRSDVRIHSRIRRAVNAVWGVTVRKNDRFIRTGWRGGAGRDGWHVFEDSASARARDGWGWHRLIHYFLSPNLEIVQPW